MSQSAIRALLVSSCAALPLLAATAASAAPHRTPIKAEKAYSTTLQAAAGERSVRTLDWRTPGVDLRFNLSQADIINDLSVLISADPLPGVDPSIPLLVQFNGAKPVEVKTQGRGFDATVALDRTRVRATGNVLRLSHAVPCGSRDGGYTVSLDESRLKLRARPKSRRLQLREVENRLAGSAFAPSSVGLIADGPLATRLQALGAQAVGLRMNSVPDFRTTTAGTDFDLVMVTRDQLHRYTNEPDILSGTGPRVEIPRANPDRLILTGDTPVEVLQTVQAFSQNFLPQSRRSTTSPGEIRVQSPLDYARTQVDGTVRLDALSVTTGAMREYTFDVADPAATEGDLVLRLTRDTGTAPGAKLKAVLNGESLGEATLDARRKTVSYSIRPGQLRGSANRLELTTKGAPDHDACSGAQPFIAVGAGSKLRLAAERPSAPTDLSRLAADGSVFGAANGADTQVVLPSRAADYNAALKVVARLGMASGQGWTDAGFQRGDAPDTSEHVLLIEPFNQIEDGLRSGAPRGLLSAWRGQPTDGDNRLASAERFATLDVEEAVRLASRRLRASGRVGAGGVAAVYPGARGQLVGVISNTPGQSFAAAVEPLATNSHWNGMSGGVSRWNGNAIVMAQSAIDAPGVAPAPTQAPAPSIAERFARLDLDRFTLPDFDTSGLAEKASETTAGLKATLAGWLDRDAKPGADDAAPIGATYEAPQFNAMPVMDTNPSPSAPAPVRMAAAPKLKPQRAASAVVPPKTVASKTVAPRAVKAPDGPAATPQLRGRIDLRDARHNAEATSRGVSKWLASSWKDKRRSVRSSLRRLETRVSRMRADLRRQTGLNKPSMPGLRIGGYEIPAAMLALVLASLLVVIGLFFIGSRSANGSHH